jgi:hypothetical protein
MSINADGYGLNEALVSAIEAIVLAVAPGSSGVSSVGGQTGVVSLKSINGGVITGSGDIPLQVVLVSGTNIKTVNGSSLLGSGNLTIAGGGASAYTDLTDHTTVDLPGTNTPLGSALSGKQASLVSGTNIKTINGSSVLGSGNLVVTGTGGVGSPNSVAYSTTLLLDDPNGYSMAPTFLATDDVLTIGPGQVDGGFTTVQWIADGTHAPVLPTGTFSRGGAYVTQAGRWNTLTIALINHIVYTQIAQGPRSPVIDTFFVADGAATHLVAKFHSDLDQTDSGVEAAAYTLFSVSGGAHNPTASAWGGSDEIVLTVPTFVAGLTLTGSFANDGSILGVDTIGPALDFTSMAIDDQIVNLSAFRWNTLSSITESGSGPYTYSATSNGCYAVDGSLKMPAGVACEIIFTKMQLDTPSADDEFTTFMFTDDNSVFDTSIPDIYGGGVGDTFFYQVRGPSPTNWTGGGTIVIALTSKVRLRKDTSNVLYVDAADAGGGSFVNMGSVAGSAIDYFIQMSMGSAGTGTQAYEVTSVSGMVPA